MKAVLLILAIVFANHAAAAVNEDRFLAAIAEREGGPKRGRHGETGPYQMMPKTRRDSGGDDKPAAIRHLRAIVRFLEERGVDVNAFNVALAWNAGRENLARGTVPISCYDYARAVEALYLDGPRR